MAHTSAQQGRLSVGLLWVLLWLWPLGPALAAPPRLRAQPQAATGLEVLAVNGGGTVVRFRQGAATFLLDLGALTLQRQEGAAAQPVEASAPTPRVAFAEGALRFYDHSGVERLAFVMDKEGRRFVLFTPTGAFFESEDGADLVAWEVDTPLDEKPFLFPLSLLRDSDRLKRERRLDPLLESAAPPRGEEITARLPPLARIRYPAERGVLHERCVTISADLWSPAGEPVTEVEVRADEALAPACPAPQARLATPFEPARKGVTRWSRSVLVPTHKPDLRLTVRPRSGARVGAPQAVQLRYEGKLEAHWPTLEVLAVGVGSYPEPVKRLVLPAKDARDFAAALQAQAGPGRAFRTVRDTVLAEQEATRAAIRRELQRLAEQPRHAQDVVALFFAGHGLGEDGGHRFYYLPAAVAGAPYGAEQWLESKEIEGFIERMQGRVLLFLDTCHAGSVFGRSGDTGLHSPLSQLAGTVIFSASQAGQQALEQVKWNNGAFTLALREGLAGAADPGDSSEVRVPDLASYVQKRVLDLTASAQEPTMANSSLLSGLLLARVEVPWLRRQWRKRPVRWATLGLGVALAATATALLFVYVHPEYDGGNTRWVSTPP